MNVFSIDGRPTMSGRSIRATPSTSGGSVTPTQNQLATDWYVDPAGTNGGNDRNIGTSPTKPLRSIAEWRSRIAGARYGATGFPTTVTIHVLSDSSEPDDGVFYGFITEGSAANVVVLGTPTVIFSGIVSAYTAYAGNGRGLLTATALAGTWTALGGISNSGSAAGRSRFIRKTNLGIQAVALIDEEGSLATRTVQIGLPCNTSETTVTGTPTVVVTNFAINDTFDVVSRPLWPNLFAIGCKVRFQNLDVSNAATVGSPSYDIRAQYVLCGLMTQQNYGGGIQQHYNCLVVGAISSQQGGAYIPQATSFLSSSLFFAGSETNMNGSENVFVNTVITAQHGSSITSLGTCHCFDNTTTLVSASRGSRIDMTGGALVGTGNTGKRITTLSGSVVTGASVATAATTDASPYSVNGVAYGAPVFDSTAGNGIYT